MLLRVHLEEDLVVRLDELAAEALSLLLILLLVFHLDLFGVLKDILQW